MSQQRHHSSADRPAVGNVVVLFVFNRPEHTRVVLERITRFNPDRLYVFADGPRTGHPEDLTLVQEVRQAVEAYQGSGQVMTSFSESNMGLKRRFTSGLNQVFSENDTAIILEDDCNPSPSFFGYASQLLQDYRFDSRVGVISGNNFCRGRWESDTSYVFTEMPRTWGWATWARVWNEFDVELKEFNRVDGFEFGRRLFGKERLARNWVKTVESSIESNTIWDHQFVYYLQSRGFLSAYPRVNLVENTGFGIGATHTVFESFHASVKADEIEFPLVAPATVSSSPWLMQAERRAERRIWVYFTLNHPLDLANRLLRYVKVKVLQKLNSITN